MGKFFQKNIAFNCCPNALRNGTLWRDHSALKHYDPWDEQNSGDKHFDFPQSLIPRGHSQPRNGTVESADHNSLAEVQVERAQGK